MNKSDSVSPHQCKYPLFSTSSHCHQLPPALLHSLPPGPCFPRTLLHPDSTPDLPEVQTRSHLHLPLDKTQAPFLHKMLHDLPSCLPSHLAPNCQAALTCGPVLFCLPAWKALPVCAPATTCPASKAQLGSSAERPSLSIPSAFSPGTQAGVLSQHLQHLIVDVGCHACSC